MAIYELGGVNPTISGSAYIAPSATVIGNVVLADNVSVWFGATLRGDTEPIHIGADSNVQEGAVLHTDLGFPLSVGAKVTVGHQAMLHGCVIGDGALIGIQAVVLNGAVIGRQCLVGAGAVITEGKTFADRSLILGAPAKVVRDLTAHEIANMDAINADYVRRRSYYKDRLVALPQR
jgi:carbonic anhydrase/acetyltransferase-like protein (isoleucine patch superfamily)